MKYNVTTLAIIILLLCILSSCSQSSMKVSPSQKTRMQKGSETGSQSIVGFDADEIIQKDEGASLDIQEGHYYAEDELKTTSADKLSENKVASRDEARLKREVDTEDIQPAIERFEIGESVDEIANNFDDAPLMTKELESPAPSGMANSQKELAVESLRGFGGGEIADVSEETGDLADHEKTLKAKSILEKEEEEIPIKQFRIRSRFPEIIFYHPGLVTDINGETGVAFAAQDAITDYMINVHAASDKGEWGYGQTSFKVFQPFFIEFNPPAKMHTNDIIQTNAAIYNYTNKSVSVKVSVNVKGGLSIIDSKNERITVPPNKVVEYPLTIKATECGSGSITITATDGIIHDSLIRKTRIYPDLPERKIYRNGILYSGENKIKFDIPINSQVMPNDFRLRIFNDPTFGALADLRKLENEPHASLSRTLAIWLNATFCLEKLSENAILTDDLNDELMVSIDSAWLRLLAFRHEEGFSFFPNSNRNKVADLLVLESMRKVKKKFIYDKNVVHQLEMNVAKLFESPNESDGDRLYAACLIAESEKIDPNVKKEIAKFMESPKIKFSSDALIVSLSLRCAAAVGAKVEFKKVEKIQNPPMQNVQTMNIPLSNISGIQEGESIFNLLNILSAVENSGESKNELRNSIISDTMNSVKNSVFSIGISPLEKAYAIMMISKLRNTNFKERAIDSINVNGNEVEFDNDSEWYEIPISLKPGMNKVSIQAGLKEIRYQISGRYFEETIETDLETMKYSFPDKLNPDRTFDATFAIYDPKGVIGSETVISLPLPCGVKPIDSPQVLARRLGADYVEIFSDEIILYYSKSTDNMHEEHQIPMKAIFVGEFYLEPPTIDNIHKSTQTANISGAKISWV